MFDRPYRYRTGILAWTMLVALAALPFNYSNASTVGPQEKDEDSDKIAESTDRYRKGTWDWNFEFDYTFAAIPNPFHSLIDLRIRTANSAGYEFATSTAGLRYRLGGISGPWFLRGSPQFCSDIVVTRLIAGPETYFLGMAVGLHYDFLQPGWRIVPFMDFRGGPGYIDASHKAQGQQNDLEFTYMWGAGFRYDFSSSASVSIGALDQHLSDAGITKNISVDSLGVTIRFEKKF